MYSSAVFTEGRPLRSEILPGQGRPPSTIFGIRKLDTGLPDCEDRFDTIPGCGGLTDGRTDLPLQIQRFAARYEHRIVSYALLAMPGI